MCGGRPFFAHFYTIESRKNKLLRIATDSKSDFHYGNMCVCNRLLSSTLYASINCRTVAEQGKHRKSRRKKNTIEWAKERRRWPHSSLAIKVRWTMRIWISLLLDGFYSISFVDGQLKYTFNYAISCFYHHYNQLPYKLLFTHFGVYSVNFLLQWPSRWIHLLLRSFSFLKNGSK